MISVELRTIIHISDLRVGQNNPEFVEALGALLNGLQPDLLILNGNLTERGSDAELVEAQKTLSGFPNPQLILPGVSDRRLTDVFSKFARFKKIFGPTTPAGFAENGVSVLGVDPKWLASDEGWKQVTDFFASADPRGLRIIACPRFSGESLNREIETRFCRGGIDFVLGGGVKSADQSFLSGCIYGDQPLHLSSGLLKSTDGAKPVWALHTIRSRDTTCTIETFFWNQNTRAFQMTHNSPQLHVPLRYR